MKISSLSVLLVAGLIVGACAGCKKQDNTATVTTSEAPAPATNAAATGLTQAVESAKQQAQEISTSVTQAANQAATDLTAATNAASTEASNLFAQARTLIAEKKYAEALNTLKQLSNLKLTPEQQKTLNDLMQQVQAALAKAGASDAAAKLGNMLGGKK